MCKRKEGREDKLESPARKELGSVFCKQFQKIFLKVAYFRKTHTIFENQPCIINPSIMERQYFGVFLFHSLFLQLGLYVCGVSGCVKLCDYTVIFFSHILSKEFTHVMIYSP